MHTFALTKCEDVFKSPFVERNSMTSCRKFILDFLKTAENFWFVIFYTHTKQWWTAKHNLTWKAWEKIILVKVLKTLIFSGDENFKKSPHLFTLIFLIYTFLIMYCYAKQCYSLPFIYNFHVMLLRINVMLPSEIFQ